MKIFILGIFESDLNNASKIHIIEVANALSRLGYEVHILIPKEKISKTILNKEVRVYTIPLKDNGRLLSAFILSIVQFIWFILLYRPFFYAVYVRWRMLPIGLFKIWTRLYRCRPVLITEHNGWAELEIKVQRNNKIMGRMAQWLQIIDARHSDAVIAVTEGIKDLLVKNNISPKKISVIGNGTNLELFKPYSNKDELKERYLGIRGKVLGFIGNISKWQRIEDIIAAFDFLAVERSNVYLVIIGSGKYYQKIEEIISRAAFRDRIFIISDVPYKKAVRWINTFDVALAPKSYELDKVGYSSLKIRDYAACGVPVISTGVKGIQELEVHGWLRTYDPHQRDGLKRLLDNLLNNEGETRKMSRKARSYAERFFSWDIVANKIDRVLYEKNHM